MRKRIFLFLAIITFCNGIPKEALLSERIVSGLPAKPEQFPFLVSIRIRNVHYCAGSILNEKWILTAAYCKQNVPLDKYSIISGSMKLNTPGDEYKITKFIVHENYNKTHNDIALIELESSLKYNFLIKPVKLPKADIADDEYLLASGWGFTTSPNITPNDLLYIYLINYNRKECAMAYDDGFITNGHICTYSKKGAGVCSGDSGGPLTAHGIIYGITVWIKPCVLDNLPFVFTRVRNYLSWIKETAI